MEILQGLSKSECWLTIVNWSELSYTMEPNHNISGFMYLNPNLNDSHRHLLPALIKIMNSLGLDRSGRRVFELGCGNGSVAYELSKLGYDVTGVDPSEQGITQANWGKMALVDTKVEIKY